MRPAVLLVSVALVACRDAIEPFGTADRPGIVHAHPRRITFSELDDRGPTWNATSDTIYYSGYSEDFQPDAPATILAVSIEGGVGRPVLRNAQAGANAQRWLVLPVRSPAGDRIAFVDLEPLNPETLCPWPDDDCHLIPGESPRLVLARLRVRDTDAETRLQDDPSVVLDMTSTKDTVHAQGFEAYVSYYPPFQDDYIDSRDFPFRPAWSPDGERIAVSDGRVIVVFDPGSGAVDTVPGTTDGMSPSWSPDGSRLAFTWSERVDSVTEHCAFGIWDGEAMPPVLQPRCYERRTRYITAPARVVTIGIDGSDRQVVTEGREPVWLPDGTILVTGPDVIATEPIRRIDAVSGETTVLLGTEGARELALSPDGNWIAYSRWPGQKKPPRDIYAVRLD